MDDNCSKVIYLAQFAAQIRDTPQENLEGATSVQVASSLITALVHDLGVPFYWPTNNIA